MKNSIKKYRALAICLLILAGCLLVQNIGMAQEIKKVGTSAATFLRIPVGARAASMGEAFAAVSDDASSLFWNPGGIARVRNYALMVDYSDWLPGLHYTYFGLIMPVQTLGNIGISVTTLGTEEMDITTPDQPMGTGETYTAASIALGVSYSRNLTERFSFGGTFKYIDERILNSNATGLALDVGAIYDTPFSGVRLGFSISNAGTKMQMSGEDLNIRVDPAPNQAGNNQSIVGQYKTDRFDLPLMMRLGLSWDVIQTSGQRLTLAADGLNPNDNGQSLNVGGEFALFNKMLLLRGGFNELFLEEREKGLTLGAGVNAKLQSGLGFSAAYAYQDFEHFGNINRFTFAIIF